MRDKESEKKDVLLGDNRIGRPIIIEDRLKALFFFMLVLALGFVALNQGIGFFYKTHFLKSPCDLCGELNPEVRLCIGSLNSPRSSYWTPYGWTDPFNTTNPYYNKTIIKK
jgi:hypothetical protein